MLVFTGCLTVPVFADTGDAVKFAVASDIHAKEEGATISVNYPESELYFHAENSGNLYCEAIGIVKSFFRQSAENGAQFILIPGDMANSGSQEQHLYFASVLDELEAEYEIPVYVVPGNHDLFRTSPEEFKGYYAHFGYDEAIAVDEATASYTADLPGDIRLIAIDSNDPGNNGDGFDDALFAWVEAQAKAAEADGKTAVAMMHHPLLDPIPFAETIMGDFIVRDHKDVAEKFTAWGIQYVFTGHEHGNNIGTYVGSNGRTVYDILTTSLTSYPLEYRAVSFSDAGMDIKCEAVDKCDFDYVGEGYTDEQLALMESDYVEYARGYFKYSIQKKIAKYITPEFIEEKLKVESGPIYDALEAVMPLVEQALQMPLYAKDTDGLSVEKLAKSASATLPESDYYNLYDLASTVVAEIYHGNENMPFESSPEGKVLVVGLNTMLKYILAEAGNEVATLALNTVISSIGLEKIDKVGLFKWNRALVLGADNLYEISYSVLGPILEKFLVNDGISDRDVVLPGPGETVEPQSGLSNFFNIFRRVIKYLLNVIKTVMFAPIITLIKK